VAWNAMMAFSFSESGRYLNDFHYVELAMRNINFLITSLRQEGRLLRSWRDEQAKHNAYLEDYAWLILALLSLYQSDPNPRWYQTAYELGEEMIAHFRDPEGGFFDTRDDHEALVMRPKDIQDNATPSGNALATTALLQLAAYTGEGRFRDLAEEALRIVQPAFLRYPTAFGKWLCALDFALGPVKEIAILGDADDPLRGQMANALWERYQPHLVAAISDFPPPKGSPSLLADRPLKNGQPTAYVCQNFVCKQPTTSVEQLLAQLNDEV